MIGGGSSGSPTDFGLLIELRSGREGNVQVKIVKSKGSNADLNAQRISDWFRTIHCIVKHYTLSVIV